MKEGNFHFECLLQDMTRGIPDDTFDEGILKYLETAKKIEKFNRESFQVAHNNNNKK